jgi:hypothetical protein
VEYQGLTVIEGGGSPVLQPTQLAFDFAKRLNPEGENVVTLGTTTYGQIPPRKVLRAALDLGFEHVFVISWNDDDDQVYVASTHGNAPINLWHLELAKKRLMG